MTGLLGAVFAWLLTIPLFQAFAIELDVDSPGKQDFLIIRSFKIADRSANQILFVLRQRQSHLVYNRSTMVIRPTVPWANFLTHPTTGGSLAQLGEAWSITGIIQEMTPGSA